MIQKAKKVLEKFEMVKDFPLILIFGQ